DRMLEDGLAVKLRQENGQLAVDVPILVREQLVALGGDGVDPGWPAFDVNQRHLHGAEPVEQRLRVFGFGVRLTAQPAENLLGVRRGFIHVTERDDAVPGDEVAWLLPDALGPFARLDALEHQAGGVTDEAIAVAEQRPELGDGRLDTGTDEGFAGATADHGVGILQGIHKSILAFFVAIYAKQPDRVGADVGVFVIYRSAK